MEKIDRFHVQTTIEKQKDGQYEEYRFLFEREVLPLLKRDGTQLHNNLDEPATTYLLRLQQEGFPPSVRDVVLNELTINQPLNNDAWYILCNAHSISRQQYMIARDKLVYVEKKVQLTKSAHGKHHYERVP